MTEVEVVTPQFEREDGKEPAPAPDGREEFEKLRDADADALEELGLRSWDGDLYLFPAEWYDHVPEGFEVTNILGETSAFSQSTHSEDRRFGALAFGVEATEENT